VEWPSAFTRLILIGGLYKDGRIHWDRQRKAGALRDYLKIGDFIYSIFSLKGKIDWKTSRHLSRRSVVGAMIKTAEKARDDSRKFWINVRDGENFCKGKADKSLRDFLISYSVNHGRGAQYSRKFNDKDIFRKCIVAWNAFRRGESTQLKIFNGLTDPKII
jgi:hypothetical protein